MAGGVAGEPKAIRGRCGGELKSTSPSIGHAQPDPPAFRHSGEVAYAASKGALASITRTLADHLADQAITLNTVNPGPVDTGYAPPDVLEAVERRFPTRRWGIPDDPARLIAWLVTDDAAWITGQTISSEGGFRRWD
ncbi:SDR family oxidoreductase [Streptosporangium subroseum]|uniref:SDR family oxidoreductase n=1 Tax=Streptosporangium subroseum TaxID=106412 RepID=UPI00341700D9